LSTKFTVSPGAIAMMVFVNRLRKMIPSSALMIILSGALMCVGADSVQAFWPHGHHRPFHHGPFHHGHWGHGHWQAPIRFSNHCFPANYWGFNTYGRNVVAWNVSYRNVGLCYTPSWYGYRSVSYFPYYVNSPYCWPYGYYNYLPAWHTTGFYFSVNQANLNPVVAQPAWQLPASGVGVLQANRLQAANAQRLVANGAGQGRGGLPLAAAALGTRLPAAASNFGSNSIPNVYLPEERLSISAAQLTPDSLDNRLAQTRAILQRIHQRQAEPLNVSAERILADARGQIASRTPPAPANFSRQSDRFETLERPSPATVSPSYLDRGDEAFALGNFRTAEIWYKQAGRQPTASNTLDRKLTSSQRQQAAIRLATAQFASGNFPQAAQTFRWILEQNPDSPTPKSGTALASASKLERWAKSLPGENLAGLYGQPEELDTQLDRLAQVALDKPARNTEELWLLGVLVGLKGSSEKSDLFLRQAASGDGLYATAALQMLEKNIESQSQLRLVAQPSRSP
jgi:tetratricopeptide (TPR) repeat protein